MISFSPSTHSEPLTPVDLFLRQQQELTAVERFARWHETEAVPAQRYSSLLPARPPRDGEQYAFEVDLDACSGCKACVTACHALNGLDDGEIWRDVGLLYGGSNERPVLQHVTAACHHCLDPACLNVCPVDAYEKDGITGIVRHLDDQCIGCQYCTLACPYDVPKYNRSKGIVRKCDLCSQRLAADEPPACAQACPQGAIRIRIVSRQSVIDDSETNLFLPGAPEPRITLPTTLYKTERVFPRNLLPADYYAVRPEHAHWPLVWMLVLTQLSVGAFLAEQTAHRLLGGALFGPLRTVQAGTALFFGLLALAASTFHLGRPLYAFRAIVGLRHSWLSREILAFGAYALAATLYALHTAQKPTGGNPWELSSVHNALGLLVIALGLAGVFCSVMIYHCTRRPLWNGLSAGVRFLGTTLLLGSATSLLVAVLTSATADRAATHRILADAGPWLCRVLVATAVAKLFYEAAIFRHLRDKQQTPLKRSARLMIGAAATATKVRFTAGLLSGVVLPLFLLKQAAFAAGAAVGLAMLAVSAVLIFAGCLTGEVLERYLFFTTVVAPRMPRGLTP